MFLQEMSGKMDGNKPVGWRLRKYLSLPNLAVGSQGQLSPNTPFWGSIYPKITIQEKWREVSLWVGDCKNTIAYQVWRWGPKVRFLPIPRSGGQFTLQLPYRKNGQQ